MSNITLFTSISVMSFISILGSYHMNRISMKATFKRFDMTIESTFSMMKMLHKQQLRDYENLVEKIKKEMDPK